VKAVPFQARHIKKKKDKKEKRKRKKTRKHTVDIIINQIAQTQLLLLSPL